MSSLVKEMLDQDTWVIPFILRTILFFMLGFSGQEILNMASRNVIMIWFDKNRGKVNAVSSVAVSLGFSSSPLWVSVLIDSNGWEHAWRYLGAAVFLFSILAYLLYKDAPEVYGLFPDGGKIIETEGSQPKAVKKQYTLKEAKTTRAFWMYGRALAFNSFFITGLAFHIVSIFENDGFAKADAISIFLPASIMAVTISTIFNFLSDYIALQLYLYLLLFGGVLSSLVFLLLSTSVGVPFLIAGFGIMGGFFAVLNAVAWPRFYGRTYLGSITGKVMSFLILASALAPSIFSLSLSTFGSYHLVGYLGLVFLVFLLIASIKAKNPQ
jgi:OFA family oxalate/formate antiporter-like MFS transporter